MGNGGSRHALSVPLFYASSKRAANVKRARSQPNERRIKDTGHKEGEGIIMPVREGRCKEMDAMEAKSADD